MSDSPNTTPMTRISRPIVEAEIELLIDMLDTLDADPDLESTGDEEPWLGAPAGIQANGHGTNWQGSSFGDDREDDGDDREEVSEDEGAQCDDEGVIDGDQEGPGEFSGYVGPCSTIETMLTEGCQ